MIGQVASAVVVAILLLAVSIGWAVRGAMEVRERLTSVRRSGAGHVAHPALVTKLSERRMVLTLAFLLGFALLLLGRLLGRDLPVMAAMVLAFTFAVFSAMITGFLIWMQAQRRTQEGRAPDSGESLRWTVWVGVAVGVLAVAYLAADVATSLTP
ncbi:MAG: hypothetical protein ABIS84_04575 [Arachnia sp.]